VSTPQLPLALRFPPDQRFAGFIGSPLALELLAAVARGEREDWTFLSGPAASGKTHLLLASAAAGSELGRRVAYLSLARARGHVRDLLALQEQQAELVALDGLDAVAGERDDEVALFDFHNRARAAGTTVMYAARLPPSALAIDLPDLRSRLAQCTQLPLDALDEAGRRAVLQRRAEARGLLLDDAVLDYLFRRVGRDLGSLTELLERLDRASLAAQRRVTVPFLRELLD
jgi:DnaA-homolog protein